MTKEEVFKILAMIESIYSFCMAKDETVTKWFEFCSSLEYEEVMKRLKNHIRRSPYPPVIADFAVFPHHYSDNYHYLHWMKEYSIK